MDPLVEANKLLGVLKDVRNVCEKKRNNAEVMRELGLFIFNMKQAVDVLAPRTLDRLKAGVEGNNPTPNENSSSIAASDELVEDLECANERMQQVLKIPRNAWNVDTLVERLRRVRGNIIQSFQTKLHISNFHMTVDAESLQQEEFHQKTSSPAQRASKAFPNSVRQNFSSVAEVERQDSFRHRVVPEELRPCLPRPGVDISPAQTSQRMEVDDDSSCDEIAPVVNILGNNRTEIPETLRNHSHAIGNTETEAFFADVLANLEVMRAEATAAHVEFAQNKHSEDEISEWFEDPITGDIMIDPIKCTDGRTYDRWTIIDNNLVKCPYDASMLDFRIAFDDIDVRARLFRAFPEKEQTYRARRQAHRQKSLEHYRKGDNRNALIKLNQVLQWNSQDEECKSARDEVQMLLQPTSVPPLSSINLVAPVSSNSRSFRERIRGCSIMSWCCRRRSPSPQTPLSRT